MNIKQYIYQLRKQIREGDYSPETREKLAYARAYMQGEVALEKYRDRAVAREIGKTHNADAQLAILFNKDIHPEEYEAYQAFRIECKAKVDAELEARRAELEEIINGN